MTSTSKGPGAAIHVDSYTIPNLLFDDIDGTSPWNFAISRLSESLKLPGTPLIRSRRDLHSKPFHITELSTRHGLKKVHSRFEELYKKLNQMYASAQRKNNYKIMGAVIGIMAKMCADALLRDKLFEKGMLLWLV